MTDEVTATFGELLRQHRRAAGLTQEELAASAGLSARGIADLEREVRLTPRRDTVDLLVRALGVSPEDGAALFAAAHRARVPVERLVRTPANGAEPNGGGGPAPGVPGNRVPHNLPAQTTHLLGRDEAVRTVVALVRRADVRLVTLTGTGGIGKTRLAIQMAADLLSDFADGVWFVRLSRLTDPSLVIPTIAETLGLKEAGDQPLADMLCRHLCERRAMLVLDNCEHVVAAAPDVATLLEGCPALTVLATSRMALHLRGEHEYPVAPLGLPPTTSDPGLAHTPERLTEYPAAALFVERARAARPDFALTAANAPVVAEICARLDGLPLAIELAAVRVKLLPPSALLARLKNGLGFLAGGARDLSERQQTMRNTLTWSENLLSAEERVLFRRLAVFAGGCTLDMAQAVCAMPEGTGPLDIDLFDGLAALVDQSLVQQREEDGEPRFGMLHVIREYASERLAASGEAEALRRAHAAFMLALVERAEPELVGPEAGMWLGRLEREHDNLRAALGWARMRGEVETGLRLVAAVFRFWMVRGHLREGRAWAEGLLALKAENMRIESAMSGAGSERIRARALLGAGVLAVYQGDNEAAEIWLEEATTRGRAAGDLKTTASALSSLGVMALQQGDLERAKTCLEESLALMRALGERRGLAVVLTNLGIVVYSQNDLEQAMDAFSQALTIGRQMGDRDLIATNLANLAAVALRQGKVVQSEGLGREALALYWDLGDPRRCAVGLEGLASSAGKLGQGERAARLLGAATVLRDVLGTPLPSNERADIEQMMAAAKAALGKEQWAAAFTAGQALSLKEAIAEALGEEDHDGHKHS